jgi:hypothetical protein
MQIFKTAGFVADNRFLWLLPSAVGLFIAADF